MSQETVAELFYGSVGDHSKQTPRKTVRKFADPTTEAEREPAGHDLIGVVIPEEVDLTPVLVQYTPSK